MARILDLLIVAGIAALGVRIYTSGLHSRYRAFFCYLIFATVRSGIVANLNTAGKAYYRFWLVSEPIEWFFYVLVVLELYSLVLEDYRGLATAGRWSLIAAISLALAASGLSLLAPSHYTGQGIVMTYYYVAERAVYFSLLVFLLTILGVLMQYPITLSRNLIVHSVVFSVYFLANTAIYAMLSLFGPGIIPAVTGVLNVVTLGSLCTWLLLLNPGGELRKQRLRPTWMPGREEALVGQLNSLNAALLRATRK